MNIKTKKIIALLTILAIVLGIMPVVSLANTGNYVSVEDKTANVGDEVTVEFKAPKAIDLDSLGFEISFDKEALSTSNENITTASFTGAFCDSGVLSSGDKVTFGMGASEPVSIAKDTVLLSVKFNVLKAGEHTITTAVEATNDDTSLDDSETVTSKVTAKIPATEIGLNKTSTSIEEGKTEQLNATLTPDNSTDTVSWESSNISVAVVTDTGLVTAVGVGNATITAKVTDAIKATCAVEVTEHVCEHANKTEIPAKAETCTETGNNKYYHCEDCGKYLKADGTTVTTVEAETISALGHEYTVEQSDGTYHWKKCSRCDATTEKVAHSGEGEWKYDDTDHWKVCGCGAIVDKVAHTAGEKESINIVPSTCKVKGSHDEVVKCTVCGKVLSTNHVEDPFAEHTPGEPVQENEVPATHAAAGKYDEVIYCKVCGEEISRTEKEIPIVPHDVTGKTWESDETNHWKTCGCGVKVEIAEHTPGDVVKENIVEPTCTAKGKHDEVRYCTVCGREVSRVKDVEDEAKGHTPGEMVKENIVEPTCTEKGKHDEVIYCKVCGEEISRTKDVEDEAKGHTPGEPVKENEVEATVDKEGSYEEVVYCKDCHTELSRTEKTTPKFVYTVQEGAGSEHKEKSEESLTFKINGKLEKFKYAMVDKVKVDNKYMTLKSGSTVLTLSADFLNTLAVGSHDISFVYDDGEVSTTFKVTEKEAEKPAEETNNDKDTTNEETIGTTNSTKKSGVPTGDNSNITFWIIGLGITAVLFVIVLKCTNKKTRKH